jgi:tetrahydromethanopterin S-methyltransferase subunit G
MILPNIAAIGQRDEKWKDKKLGTSTTTIGQAGCVLTCATIIARFYGHDIWPDWLNEQMVKVGGYYDKNLWQWHKLSQVFSDIKVHELIDCYSVPAPLEKIDQRLEEGHPVIVCVDFDPKAGVQTHFVVIFGKEGEDYYIADPWYNDVALFSERYGDPAKAIYAIRMYDGPLTPPQASNQELDLLKKRLEEIEASVRTLRGDLSELLGQMESWQEWRDTANDRLDELEKRWREVKSVDLKLLTK